MATTVSRKVVDELIEMIKQEEFFMLDTFIFAIVEYTTDQDEVKFGITWKHDPQRHRYMTHNPPYVNHPEILWCKTETETQLCNLGAGYCNHIQCRK